MMTVAQFVCRPDDWRPNR